MIPFLQITGLIGTSFAVAYVVLLKLANRIDKANKNRFGFMSISNDAVAFLFEDEHLLNATDTARKILADAPNGTSEYMKLLAVLAPRFPGLSRQISELADNRIVQIESSDGTTHLTAEWRDGLAKIELVDTEVVLATIDMDRHSLIAMEHELVSLRTTAENAPFLVWRQKSDGTITWANNSYVELAELSRPDVKISTWPPAQLFKFGSSPRDDKDRASVRCDVKIPGEANSRWFECYKTQSSDGDMLFTAVAVDGMIKAETSLRDFVQTLTKTFAHLAVGLAIFDKQRQLVLFNPALTDLTSLPPEFLSARPKLHTVLDRLREKRMIPDQKDYKSWRHQMLDLETAALNGTYEETWTLASGQTYRVTGRPHPDGAVAFMIEDISTEISLTRRFRAELETGQAIIDSMDEAIAVFGSNGCLTLANRAYSTLWNDAPDEAVGDFSIVDATKGWSELCAPSPIWGDAREFVGTYGERIEWVGNVKLRDGRDLSCRFSPLSGGATLIGFSTPNYAANSVAKVSPNRLLPKPESATA